MSSLMDTWLSVINLESNGERNRGLYVLKSRGMSHSNQVREFQMTSAGVQLLDAYVGPAGVLIGSARLAQEAQERRARQRRAQDIERKRRDLARKRDALAAEEDELRQLGEEDTANEVAVQADRAALAASRDAAE